MSLGPPRPPHRRLVAALLLSLSLSASLAREELALARRPTSKAPKDLASGPARFATALGVLAAVLGRQVPPDLLGAAPDLVRLVGDLAAGVCGVVGVGMRETARPG